MGKAFSSSDPLESCVSKAASGLKRFSGRVEMRIHKREEKGGGSSSEASSRLCPVLSWKKLKKDLARGPVIGSRKKMNVPSIVRRGMQGKGGKSEQGGACER